MPSTIPCPANRPTLHFGASGPIVKEMQKALNRRLAQLDSVSAYPLHVATSGYFDRETRDAVKYLQCLAFLPLDGIVRAATWEYLCYGSESLPTLHLGKHGWLVQAVQEALQAEDYYLNTVDGVFGAEMEEAVRKLQAEYCLVTDGIIGPLTWNVLSKLDSHAFRCNINIFVNS